MPNPNLINMKSNFIHKKYIWLFLLFAIILFSALLGKKTPGIYYFSRAYCNITFGDVEEAEIYMLKYYEKDPDNPMVNELLGNFYFYNVHNFERAIFFYEYQLLSNYDSESMRNLCLAHEYLNHIEDSIHCNIEYINKSGGDYETYFYLGMLFYEKQLFDEALYCLNKSYNAKPECRSAAYLVELHYLNLHFSEARKSCEKLQFCTVEVLKDYPLEDFVFELCFDGDTHGN